MTIAKLNELIVKEMDYGRDKFGAYHNAHEHYAVLQEEVEEWWDAVKGNYADCAMYELVQVAAVAMRYILENNTLDIEDIQAKRHGKAY
jgi:hypothetical protein